MAWVSIISVTQCAAVAFETSKSVDRIMPKTGKAAKITTKPEDSYPSPQKAFSDADGIVWCVNEKK
jgi:hypothetical protein